MPLTQWLKLQEGVLYLKTSPNQEDQNDMRLVLPQAYYTLAVNGCHNLGHSGTEHMLDLLCDHFYWSMMQGDMDQHIWGCSRCNRFKACPHHDELYPILAPYLLELVHTDWESQKQERCKCTDHYQPFYQICPSNNYHFTNSPCHGLGLVGWALYPLWVS